jgi:hypothetical protein
MEQARPMLESTFPDEPADDTENVDRVLRQLHAADPGGQDVRYQPFWRVSEPLTCLQWSRRSADE